MGTFQKFFEISHRINHPRQNSSSINGTFTTLASTRKMMKVKFILTPGCSELLGDPTRLLLNSQLWRYAGHGTSGPTQIAKTATPSSALPKKFETRQGITGRDTVSSNAKTIANRMA